MKHPNLKNRIGRIKTTEHVLNSLSPTELSSLFEAFYPVKIDVDFQDRMEYTGYSEHFDKIEEGEIIPEYSVTIYKDGGVDMERIVEQQRPLE